MQIIEWIRLETFVSLAAVIVLITQIIKAIPVELTSSYPKTISWIVMAIVIGGIGYYEKADPSTVVTIGIAIGLAANGFYDVVSHLISAIGKAIKG